MTARARVRTLPRVKKLALVLPLGALVALAVLLLVARFSAPLEPVQPIEAASGASLQPLDFPKRDARFESRVVAPSGAGVARATVWLTSGAEVSFVETGADGAFAFDRVQPGPRELVVVAEGFAPRRATFAESEPHASIALGEPLPPPPSLPAMKRSTLRGTVSGLGFVAAGAQICLTPRAPVETLGAPIPVRVECADDGAFEFQDLIEGEYTPHVYPRWAVNGSWPDLLVPTGGASGLEFRHEEGAHRDGLALTTTCSRIRGTLRDALGGPLEGALVLVALASDPSRVWPPATSAVGGAFEVGDLPAGKYTVSVRAGGDAAQLEIDLRASEVRELNVRPLDVAKPR